MRWLYIVSFNVKHFDRVHYVYQYKEISESIITGQYYRLLHT